MSKLYAGKVLRSGTMSQKLENWRAPDQDCRLHRALGCHFIYSIIPILQKRTGLLFARGNGLFFLSFEHLPVGSHFLR